MSRDSSSLNGVVLQRGDGKVETYAYDAVFDAAASQSDVFSGTLGDLIPAVVDGTNATLACYGQTGSGKTHTTIGAIDGTGRIVDDGIVLQAVEKIFSAVQERASGSGSSSVSMQCLEIYNVSTTHLAGIRCLRYVRTRSLDRL